ncbi:MAG: hypothetical protein KF883_04800 [Thermomicrobiales bacterium]|nr:hypothetical protein [Thermomicrobiales bacterium]
MIAPETHGDLLAQEPDLVWSVVMPWVGGETWYDIVRFRRGLTPEQSQSLAASLAGVLGSMEAAGIAHCDLSGPNTIIDLNGLRVSLVDVEDLYMPGVATPEHLPAGSYGYAHPTAPGGIWGPEGDRFAGGVLLAEMLGWSDPAVRRIAVGEQFFDASDIQQPTERYEVLRNSLAERYGHAVRDLFEAGWFSKTLADCPSFQDWQSALGIEPVRHAEKSSTSGARVDPVTSEMIAEAGRLLHEGRIDDACSIALIAHRANPQASAEVLTRALIARAAQHELKGDGDAAHRDYLLAASVVPEGGLAEELAGIMREFSAPAATTPPPVRSASSPQTPTIPIAIQRPPQNEPAAAAGGAPPSPPYDDPVELPSRWRPLGVFVGLIGLIAVLLAAGYYWNHSEAEKRANTTSTAVAMVETHDASTAQAEAITSTQQAETSATTVALAAAAETATAQSAGETETAQAFQTATQDTVNALSTQQTQATQTAEPKIRALEDARREHSLAAGSGRGLEGILAGSDLSAAGVDLVDMIVRAAFVNPSDVPWDFGFSFRIADDQHETLHLTSNGELVLIDRDGVLERFGPVSVSANDGYRLELMVVGSTVDIFLNGNYVTTMRLQTSPVSGDVAVSSSALAGSAGDGSVRFEGFQVWNLDLTTEDARSTGTAEAASLSATEESAAAAAGATREAARQTAEAEAAQATLAAEAARAQAQDREATLVADKQSVFELSPPGGEEGSLIPSPQGQIFTGVAPAVRDFIASATFVNPGDPAVSYWDFGFLFREGQRLIFLNDGTWQYAGGEGTVAEGQTELVNTGQSASNTIEIRVSTNRLWIFVNGSYVDEIVLIDGSRFAPVQLGAWFDQIRIFESGDPISSIGFERFRIWNLEVSTTQATQTAVASITPTWTPTVTPSPTETPSPTPTWIPPTETPEPPTPAPTYTQPALPPPPSPTSEVIQTDPNVPASPPITSEGFDAAVALVLEGIPSQSVVLEFDSVWPDVSVGASVLASTPAQGFAVAAEWSDGVRRGESFIFGFGFGGEYTDASYISFSYLALVSTDGRWWILDYSNGTEQILASGNDPDLVGVIGEGGGYYLQLLVLDGWATIRLNNQLFVGAYIGVQPAGLVGPVLGRENEFIGSPTYDLQVNGFRIGLLPTF